MSELDNIIHECIDSGMTEEEAYKLCQDIADGRLREETTVADEHVMKMFETAVGKVLLRQSETNVDSEKNNKTIEGISPRELYDLLQDVYQLVDSVKHINGYRDQAYDVGSSVDEIMSELTALNEIPTESTNGQESNDPPFSEGDIVRDKEETGQSMKSCQ